MVADAGQFKQYVGRNLGGPVLANERDAPVPASGVYAVIEGVRRKVNTLEAMTEAMEQKLGPILLPVPPAAQADKESGISGPSSAISQELSELEYRLGNVCRRLDQLISRVEI